MCRNIKTLRPRLTDGASSDDVTEDEVRAAALQYVRKISGMRAPARRNTEAFDHAVEAVAAATRDLLDRLEVGPRGAGRAESPASSA